MSYENLLAGLYTNNLVQSQQPAPTITPTPILTQPTIQNPFTSDPRTETIQQITNETKPKLEPEPSYVKVEMFSVDNFKAKLKKRSATKNKDYQDHSNNLSTYDIFSCARIPYFRINSFPLEDYSNSWLPIELRGTLGTACHDFLQAVPDVFTETEACLKVPEIRFSGRLDGLINDNVLVEIKSCGYADYDKILKSNKPRIKDFYQTIMYKYVLENYLEIAKQQPPTRGGGVPKLDKYDIQYIQFVYICHELICAEADSFEQSLEFTKTLKRQMDSQRNPFWFIKVLTIDLSKVNVEPYESYIKDKLQVLNHFLSTNTIPPLDNKYIDKKDCYFCLYNKICDNY